MPGNGQRPLVSTLDFPVGACKPLPSVIHSQVRMLPLQPERAVALLLTSGQPTPCTAPIC